MANTQTKSPVRAQRSKSIGKGELIKQVNEKLKATETYGKLTPEVFEVLMKVIQGNIKRNVRVVIPDFGSFGTADRKARKAHNPANFKQKIDVPAKTAVVFRPSLGLKQFVNPNLDLYPKNNNTVSNRKGSK